MSRASVATARSPVRIVTAVALALVPAVAAAQQETRPSPDPAAAPGAAGPGIVVGAERRIDGDSLGRSLVEPHLSVNPSRDAHLVVGVIVSDRDLAEPDCRLLASFDGGETWTGHDLGLSYCADPWGVVLEDGAAVMTVLGRPPGGSDIELLVYRSEDGGRTWSLPPVSLGPGHDHQTVAVDASGGERHGTLYVVSARDVRRQGPERFGAAVFVARSEDGGRSFAEPEHHFPLGTGVNTVTPVVQEDGGLLIPFRDYARRDAEGLAPLDVERDWIALSLDGGATLTPPFMISDRCERSWSELGLDRSGGPWDGRLYHVCNDGEYAGIWVHSSDDGGFAWSAPDRVAPGPARRPYGRAPALEVAPGGTVAVSYYDGSRGPGFMRQLRCQRPHIVISADGGASWLGPEPVSTADSCPMSPRTGMVALRFPAGGDYHGLAPLGDGSFRVVWADARSGVFELWTNVVRLEGGP